MSQQADNVEPFRRPFNADRRAVAAPAPLARTHANPRFDRVHDDVSSRPNELLCALDPCVTEAVAEEVRDPPVLQACSPRETTVELTHPVRESGFGRRNQQVVVIRDQAVRIQAPVVLLNDAAELKKEVVEVAVVEEDA